MSTSAMFDSAFLAKLEQLHLLARRMFRGDRRAERRTRQAGASLEFADYREYTPGDEPRSIDWHAYGRLERLFVKLYEHEQDLPVTFLVDCSASMSWLPEEKTGALTKFDHARRLCAALAYIALANLDRVNIHFFAANSLAELGVVRGKSGFHSVLKFLGAPSQPDGPMRLMQGAQALVQHAHRRGLVFVLSDFFDPLGYEEPLSLLLHSQFEVQVLQVLALAGVRVLLPSSDVAVIFAVDASASISPEAAKAARKFVGGVLRAQRGGEHAGVVGFGKDAEVWQSPAEHAAFADWPPVAADGRRRADLFNPQSSIGSPQSKGARLLPSAATDIGRALDFSSALFPADQSRRVVLLSDGNDTAGHALEAAARLRALWRRSVDGGAAESRKTGDACRA
ncbi:MAG: DUF58 domain-containing protein [Verrucomicrobiota bacterium]